MGNSGCFEKGHVPFNKGKKLEEYLPEETIEKIKQTTFKEGQTAGEKSNMWKGGVQTPNNDCVYLYDGVGKRIRRPKAVYEEANGPIPKGWILFHIDGIKHNDALDNLIAIPRSILVQINAGRLNRNFHEIKSAVSIWYEELAKSGGEDFWIKSDFMAPRIFK